MAQARVNTQRAKLRPEDVWRRAVQAWYPDWRCRTYCVPPVYFNRVPYRTENVAGRPCQVLDPQAGDSDIRDDFAQQHVLACLEALGNTRSPEAMFLVSNLQFRDYLVKEPSLFKTQLPRGEFDIILIHRQYGIIIGEIKSVGQNSDKLSKSNAESDADVVKRVQTAIKQMKKQLDTMRDITRHVEPQLRISNCLILPYISRSQLKDVLSSDPNLARDLQQSLGAQDPSGATELCICADELSEPSAPMDVSPEILARLKLWFERRTGGSADPYMSENVYLDLIARICGPATVISVHCNSSPNVEVHTMGEAVSETGERISEIVLTPDQFDILNIAPQHVWITGPPGTGKTITVMLEGLVWLRQGWDVHILSCNIWGLSASFMIKDQLAKTLAACTSSSAGQVGTPHLLAYDFNTTEDDVDTALTKLKGLAGACGKLCVIADECNYLNEDMERYKRFFNELISSNEDLFIWATSVGKTELPDCMQKVQMTAPMRCPPVVVREVKPGVDWFPLGDSYTESVCPPPCYGPPVIWLSHSGPGHHGDWPIECTRCGSDLIGRLRELGVGVSGSVSGGPPPLQYRDVLIITRGLQQQESGDTAASASADHTPSHGFLVALRNDGIPMSTLQNVSGVPVAGSPSWNKIKDMATAAKDEVIVADHWLLRGLEKKITVVLASRDPNIDRTDEHWAMRDRLDAMSRSTSQLIVVTCPSYPLQNAP